MWNSIDPPWLRWSWGCSDKLLKAWFALEVGVEWVCSHSSLMQHLMSSGTFIVEENGGKLSHPQKPFLLLQLLQLGTLILWVNTSGQKLSEGSVFCPLGKADSCTLNPLKRLITENVQLLMLCDPLLFRDLSWSLCLGNGWMKSACYRWKL